MATENEESMNESLKGLSLTSLENKFLMETLSNEELINFMADQNGGSAQCNGSNAHDTPSSSQNQTSDSSHGSTMSVKDETLADNSPAERKSRKHSSNKIPRNPNMKVILKDRMVRLRYESELGNRNIGKDELISIKFEHITSEVMVRVHTIHKDNKKAHPYLLMGKHCREGVFLQNFKPSVENNSTCVVKATIKIPLKNQYEDSLKKKKTMMEKDVGLHIADMKKGDYWSANKGMRECQSLRLCIEAYYADAGGQAFLLHEITEPMSNAKVGKTFKIHTIRPCAAPCIGVPINNLNDYMLIVLTADSFDPKQVSVVFKDDEGWTAEATNVTIIKNVVECEIPAYKVKNLQYPVDVKVELKDISKDMISMNAADFQYTPCEDLVRDVKIRKLSDTTFNNIPLHVHEESVRDKKDVSEKHAKGPVSRKRERRSLHSNSSSRTASAPSPFSDVSNDSNTNPIKFDMTPTINFVDSSQHSVHTVNLPPAVNIDLLSEEGMKLEVGDFASVARGYDPILDLTTTINQSMMTFTASSAAPLLPTHQAPSITSNLNTVSQPQPQPTVQSPTFNPNRGKFKTVNCEQTGQTFILDQNNKVILVMGGNSGAEATEIPEYNISSPAALTSIPPAVDTIDMIPSTGTPSNQAVVYTNAPNMDLSTSMMQSQYGSQNVYPQAFTSVSQGQSNMTFNPSANNFPLNRLCSSDLQMDGAECLGLTEVTVTTSKNINPDLGDNIMQGDEEEPKNDSNAEVSQVEEIQEKEKHVKANQNKQTGDMDEVMNSLSSLDLKEDQTSKQSSQS